MAIKTKSRFYNNNENLPINEEYEWSEETLAEFKKCKDDVMYFAENYFYIVTADYGKQKIALHDVQKDAIQAIIDNRYTIICASRQIGKALALDTPIPTPNGWTTMGKIRVGDKVFDDEGNICSVTHVHDIRHNRKCYAVKFSNGETIIADEEHDWMTQTFAEGRRKNKPYTKKTTKEIKESLISSNNTSNHRIKMPANGIILQDSEFDIHPYLLGLWLGDGNSYNFTLTGENSDIINIKNYLVDKNILTEDNIALSKDINLTYQRLHIKGLNKNNESYYGIFNKKLKQNKRIPSEYLRASVEQRLELLRGLMDTDGSACNKCHFYNTNHELIQDVEELLRSLSINFSVSKKENYCNGKKVKDIYVISFNTDRRVFNLERKIKKQHIIKNIRNKHVYITDVEEVASVPVRCITVDSKNHMYLCGKSMIPTSNTTMMTIVCLWLTMFRKDFKIAILANKEDMAIEILDRIKMAYEEMPNWLKSGVEKFSELQVRFVNGSRIFVSTTSANAIRGKTVNLVFLDEFAFVPKELAEQFFKSVLPTISSGKTTKLVVTSTPNGSSGKFYEIFSEAEKGTNGWAFRKIYWHQIPGRDEAWKQEVLKMNNYDMALWNQEYDIHFLENGVSTINADLLARLKLKTKQPLMTFDNGDYKIWEEYQEGHIYVFGVDTAQGVGQDYTVAQILDITDLTDIRQVALFACNTMSPFVFAEKLFQIAISWGRPFLCIEAGKDGNQVLDALMNIHGYDNIVNYNMKNDKRGYYQKPGIFCHSDSKYVGITNMKYWVEHMESVTIYDLATLKEFETFVRKTNKTWSAATGFHDDRIMALIWALILLETEIAETYLSIIEYDDVGKPMRIEDPNYDIAIQMAKNSAKNISFARVGAQPLPVIFSRGNDVSSPKEYEMSNLFGAGFRIL